MKLFRLPLFGLIALMGAAVGLQSCGDDDNEDPITNPAAKYVESLELLYPNARSVEWEKIDRWTVAEFDYLGIDTEVWFDNSAAWQMTRTELLENRAALPEAVDAALTASAYGNWAIDDIDYYERPADDFYVIEVEQGSQDKALYITPLGEIKDIRTDVDRLIKPSTKI